MKRRIQVTHDENKFRRPGFIGLLVVPPSKRRRGVQRHRGEGAREMMIRLAAR